MFGYSDNVSVAAAVLSCHCCGAPVTRTNSGYSYTCACTHLTGPTIAACNWCPKCLNCCECDNGSQSNQGGHVCSFLVKCSNTHCNINVCSCGKHRNNATCGGGCKYIACNHCSARYCAICNNHSCSCNTNGRCYKPHCTNNVYCSWCGHTCDGDHKYNLTTCNMAHCSDFVCTVAGCNEHKSGQCGGGHVEGNWFLVGESHKLRCSICNETIDTHGAVWGAPNAMHTSSCRKCSLTNTHTANWGAYQTIGNMHTSYCTVSVGGSVCPAAMVHIPTWSGYVKADGGGEASSAQHIRRCSVTGCNVVSDGHGFSNSDKWYKVDEEKHRRTCSNCGLTQTLAHNFISRESIDDDIENHYKVCYTCVDDNDVNYRVLERHVDEEINGRGNGICDLCNKELWRVSISDLNPTNKDITAKVEVFSDYADRIELPNKMIDLYGNEIVSESGFYIISENTDSESGKYYVFCFETPDVNVPIEITNISKDIYGKVYISPDVATKGEVTLKLVVSDERFDKTIDLKFENESWDSTTYNSDKDVYELTRTVENNGEYVFYARDSLGNEKEFSVNVNNIVSGFGTVTTTFDAFQHGYIFTDILVNVTQEWILDDAIINCLSSSVYKYKVDGDGIKVPVSGNVNKVQITDEMGNIVTSNILESGIYYVKVAIGGPSVFNDVGTYMVEIMDTKIQRSNGDTLVTLSGKNRIEVVVQSLNDLT